jgi:hypothetical protein
MTTMLAPEEPPVAKLCDIPPTHALVALIALGSPQKQVTRLSRRRVEAFTTIDSFAGECVEVNRVVPRADRRGVRGD